MGIGTGLAFVAIGAILAFATRFHVSGIDIQMIGWILLLVGAAWLVITFAYTRPRRRRQVAEIVEDDPMYVTREENDPPIIVQQAPERTEPTYPESHVRSATRRRRDVPPE